MTSKADGTRSVPAIHCEPDIVNLERIDEAAVAQFEKDWRSGSPQPLPNYLPAEDSEAYLGTLSELVHIELEFAWKRWSALRAMTVADSRVVTALFPARVESYLAQFPSLKHSDAVLELVKAEFGFRYRFSESPAIDEYLARFPQLVDLGNGLAAELASVRHQCQRSAGNSQTVRIPSLENTKFGDYHLSTLLGRGGMGVVYRATQLKTDREVALKFVRRDFLDGLNATTRESLLERFRQEAKAAARLEHPNIVSVYDVGEVDGQPYFSMQLVDGFTLTQLLDQRPLPQRDAARYLMTVSQAVDAAHKAGVLHRDLKPQNIIVASKTDVPLVADFGLAKLAGGSSEITRQGEVMGTPAYMAPEQATNAADVGPPADVYSLGATLYHALTGRPPFHAATAVETMRQVQDAEPLPPSRLNRSISKDLETICLKSLSKRPEQRYRTAGEMADDLGRYLRNEPILARPIAWWERGIRFCRRRPGVAAALAFAVCSLAIALAGLSAGLAQTARAWQEEKAMGRYLNGQIDQFFTTVSENDLLNQPGLQPLRRDLLAMAKDHYQKFVTQRYADQTARSELARANFRLGVIHEALGDFDAAVASYEQAQDVQESLLEQHPNSAPRTAELAKTQNALARLLTRQNNLDAAYESFAQARALRQELAREFPNATEYLRGVANCTMNMGLVRQRQAKPKDAKRLMTEAQEARLRAVQIDPHSDDLQTDLGAGYLMLAAMLNRNADFQGAELPSQQACEIYQRLRTAEPESLTYRHQLALSHRMVGDCLIRQTEDQRRQLNDDDRGTLLNRALVELDAAAQIAKPLALQNPEVMEYQKEHAAILQNRGFVLQKQGLHDEAVQAFLQVEQTLARWQGSLAVDRDLAVAMRERAFSLHRAGQTEVAHKVIAESLDRFARCRPSPSTEDEIRRDRARAVTIQTEISNAQNESLHKQSDHDKSPS